MITTLVLSACLSAQIVVDPLTPFPSLPDAKEKKAAVPKDAEPGMKKVREVLGAAPAKTPSEKIELAMRLVTLGVDTKEDPVTQWAALSEARRLAVEADNALVGTWIIDAQDRLFELDLGKQRLDLLGKIAQGTPAPPLAALQAAAKIALVAARDAELSAGSPEAYDTVQSLADLATELATKAKDSTTRETAQKFRDNVKVYRQEFEDAQAAKSKLESAADDVEANRTWGKHLALNRLDWEKGLPFLAKADGPLGEAARADQAPPNTPEEQEAAANRWWKLADTDKKLAARETSALRTRAGEWYRKALPRLQATARPRVEAKLKNVPPASSLTIPKPFDPDSLKSGLMVRTYPRTAQQKGGSRFVPLEQLGEPAGEPKTSRTLETFTYPADVNLVAFGYMRVDSPGSYNFHCPNHQSVLILVDGRPLVPIGGKSAVSIRINRKGYVPLAIIGAVDTREIHLEWLSDGPVRPTAPMVFHDPERLKP